MVPVTHRNVVRHTKTLQKHLTIPEYESSMSTSECESSTGGSLSKASVTITSQVHLPSPAEGGNVFLPLCSKPSTLKAAHENPTLIETYIRNALLETDEDIVIFIADGEVMESATMAMGNSKKKAAKTAARISTAIRTIVDDALVSISSRRIKGVIHWSEVVASKGYQAVFSELEEVVHSDSSEEAVKEIQVHVKTLVKNLFTQRVEKAKKQGLSLTNVFSGKGLELLPKERYHKRYRFLERSCILEISSILAGFEHNGQLFTEMRYLTNNPTGMSFIAECVQKIRDTLKSVAAYPTLKEAAAKTHGITFARWEATESASRCASRCPTPSLVSESESEQQAPRVMRKVTWGI